MFICQACNEVIGKKEKPVMVVTKYRTKEYYKTDKDGKVFPVKPSPRKKKYGDIAQGLEIEQVIQCCSRCAGLVKNGV
jgi:hypothetical protein